jgi:hypothetical protein
MKQDMQIANSAAGLLSRLQGDDLMVCAMPAEGLRLPGANDAVVTPDGIVVVDSDGTTPLFFITSAGQVIGRAAAFAEYGA